MHRLATNDEKADRNQQQTSTIKSRLGLWWWIGPPIGSLYRTSYAVRSAIIATTEVPV